MGGNCRNCSHKQTTRGTILDPWADKCSLDNLLAPFAPVCGRFSACFWTFLHKSNIASWPGWLRTTPSFKVLTLMKFCDSCVFFLSSMMENQMKNIQVVLAMKTVNKPWHCVLFPEMLWDGNFWLSSSSSSAFPSYISDLWVHHFWVRFLRMWPFSNPATKVVTFSLHGWCVLGVLLLPAFTRLGHEHQDLLSPCDEMHVCTD